MDWAQILVIVLAVLFAVFLAVAIALAVVILKVTKQIKATAASAERTVRAFEGSVSAFHKAALPLAVSKGILNQVMKRSRKKERVKENE